MHSLPVLLRIAGRPVILLGDGDAAAAKRRLLERAGARIVGEEDCAPLAIVAIDDEAAARDAIVRLRDRGILINATDRPDQCDFTIPAIVDRDPVIIAIGTGGASAGLAKALRIAIEALLPDRLGDLARGLHAARGRIRQRWPGARERRLAIDDALSPGGMLDPLGEPGSIETWLTTEGVAPAGLIHIRLRSPDPDDLTLREARLLGRADHVYHASGVPHAILARARADAARSCVVAPPDDAEEGLSLWLDMADA